MIRIITIITIVLVIAKPSQAQTSNNFYDLVPKGYDTLVVEKGDLNEDGHDDIVLVCLLKKDTIKTEEDIDDTGSRPIIILLWTSDGYKIFARNDNAILCRDCGGIFGDPFKGIEINPGGVLTIHHYGGSSWRWSYDRKFKWQNDNLLLIGKTNLSYWNGKMCKKYQDFAGTDLEDINLVTGKRHRKQLSAQCKLVLDKWDSIPIEPLIPLSEFYLVLGVR